MKEPLEELVWVVGVGTAVAMGAKRLGVPFNVMLVVAGLFGALFHVVPPVKMDPELVLLVFLPILVFEGALFADATSLRRQVRPILVLALPGVAISLLITASVATIELALPFAAALLLGALLSITDTVSVLLAFRSERVSQRLAAIMEGESLFNDGTALVLVSVCTSVVASGVFSASNAARSLLLAIVGGVGVGAAVGVVGAAVLRVTPDPLTTILASTVIVFTSSLAAEHLLASPVIAVVVTGMILGAAARQHLEPARVLALNSFWETAGFVVNVFLFLLVGMQIEASMLWREGVAILLALIALHVGRAAAVYGSFGVMRLLRPDPVPLRFQHVMVFGNIKGALSMAAVLALPPELPFRARIVTIVFGVTFVTLLTQALPFRAFLRAMGVVIPASDLGWEDARATLIAARRGQLELDELLAAGLVARHEHAERRAAFQQEIIRAERVLRAAPEIEDDPLIAQVVLLGQKAALADAVRRGLVSEEAASARIDEIDRKLVAASVHHGGD